MELLYPNMLYALFALIIPLIIHLFNFRRHKVVLFTNTSVLKTIEQENHKTKKIKYLLVLLTRLLFIAALVIAFAFPYKKGANTIADDKDNLIAVYIDNSLSMQSHSSQITLFDDARNSAMELIENIGQDKKFVLITNDRNPVNEYPMNKDEMLYRLMEMKVEAAPLSFSDMYSNLSVIRKKHNFKSASLFAYSDFQKNMINVDDIKNDSTIQMVLLPLESDFQNNVYIDSVWLKTPVLQKNISNEINARIVNESNIDIKALPVNFSVDDKVVAFNTIDIKPNSFADVSMQFLIENDGDNKAKVSINDNPICFDDDYYLTLKLRPTINIAEITDDESDSYIKLLFGNEPSMCYKSMSPYQLDADFLNNAQLVVLDAGTVVNDNLQQTLLDYSAQGASLLLLNDENTDNSYIYNKLGIKPKSLDDNPSRLEYVAKQNSFFDDVFVKMPDNADLPMAQKHIRFDMAASDKMLNIISLQNSDPFLMMCRNEKGSVFVISTSLNDEYTELVNHTLFVPLMYRMAFFGAGIKEISYTIGKDKILNINDIPLAVDDRISLVSDNNLYEIYPLVENRNMTKYLNFYDDIPASGFYDIMKNNEYVSTVAWNDSREESEMSFYKNDELVKMFKDNEINVIATVDIDDVNSGNLIDTIVKQSSLWRVFAILALILLLIEILILRFWK